MKLTIPRATKTINQRTKKLTRRNASNWYSLKENKHEDRAEVFIFDEIGFFGVTAQEFVKEISAIKASNIDLRLNTPGGNVFEGMAIFNALQSHPAKITTHIDGLAASIGSVIALAGDEINMAKNAFMMIHESWTIVLGGAADLRKEAEVLDKIDLMIADVYAAHTGEDLEVISQLMAEETWFTAQEAFDIGLIDNIIGESNQENHFDLSVFNHAPKELISAKVNESREYTERDVEKILRDAGIPKSKSKAIAAGCRERTNKNRRDAGESELEVKTIISNIKSILRG